LFSSIVLPTNPFEGPPVTSIPNAVTHDLPPPLQKYMHYDGVDYDRVKGVGVDLVRNPLDITTDGFDKHRNRVLLVGIAAVLGVGASIVEDREEGVEEGDFTMN